ncbi:RnfABCDGE type electron transport complex subunit D [[Clostridium] leptum]|uniref:Ion-translocating oxidoreductase complex subunit D n=1 Tax=Solibaculum mannosilyticum TaxID=2780922 RepID=A0A7I8D490_9FIRM|nr:RnfABCDGE type electron transport complex subunit D [Solibaculum mannosilyticum]MCO7137241.1 RnfABCDGE type electron transport complex subunit D [[Clostridium] leptum]BCI61577.1 electron transport complex subunit D [Solibaculum mannosilyticum]CZT55667.1 Electron transport complex protein RnfD [Eubacteriaceae bacterium CHKCI005]
MERLIVSSSPHLRSGDTTQKLMLDVIIALCPALIASVILFGWRALLLEAVTVASCVVSEYLCRKIMKRNSSIEDLSAVVTGLLLAFNLPVTLPLWMAALGGAIAIVVVKQLFGGIGHNFVNPALTARIVLMVSFPSPMTNWVQPLSADAVTTATPLGIMAEGTGQALPSLTDMFFGLRAGCLGETCAVALLLGGLYLVIRRVISPVIPLCFMGMVAAMSLLMGLDPLTQLLSGGVMLGAIFMATDYVTSPINFWGRVVFGLGCGFLTMVIRQFGSLPEGVSFSIVLMNILTPHIERLTYPKSFGEAGAKA